MDSPRQMAKGKPTERDSDLHLPKDSDLPMGLKRVRPMHWGCVRPKEKGTD